VFGHEFCGVFDGLIRFGRAANIVLPNMRKTSFHSFDHIHPVIPQFRGDQAAGIIKNLGRVILDQARAGPFTVTNKW